MYYCSSFLVRNSVLLPQAKGFHERGVNVSVIVIDYMHWIHMGDFAFDPKSWPDVPKMMKTLESYGMRVRALARWPTNKPASACCGLLDTAIALASAHRRVDQLH